MFIFLCGSVANKRRSTALAQKSDTGSGPRSFLDLWSNHSIVNPLIKCGLTQSVFNINRSPIRIPVASKIIIPYLTMTSSSFFSAILIFSIILSGIKSILRLAPIPLNSFPTNISCRGASVSLCI